MEKLKRWLNEWIRVYRAEVARTDKSDWGNIFNRGRVEALHQTRAYIRSEECTSEIIEEAGEGYNPEDPPSPPLC